MRALSASELLGAWERGLAQQSVERALPLLAAASPETPPDELAKLTIGQRDAHLLTLREWAFGSKLVSLATCPGCGERVELTFNVADIRIAPRINSAKSVEKLSLTVADYEIRFRLPNSFDLAAIDVSEGAAITRKLLLERCLVAVQHNGEERSLDELPKHVVEAVVEQMAQGDPQANVQLSVSCPSCSHQWQAAFDILSFFWSEITAWAPRILREVHLLASAYGWSEDDILEMSPWRRGYYLEMVSR